jgi:TusA-related sulfurtransferase
MIKDRASLTAILNPTHLKPWNSITTRFLSREVRPMIADKDLNLSGLNCPQHVMRCKAALVKTPGGGLLHVVVTDPRCDHDIRLLVSAQGDEIEHMETHAGVREYWIRRHAWSGFGSGIVRTTVHATTPWFGGWLNGLLDRLLPWTPAQAR